MFRPLSITIMSFVLYSMAGWVFEVLYCSVKEGHPINRGFLNGPYCPIYGVGACFVGGMLAGIRQPVVLFIVGAVLSCCVEYLTSWVMEFIFHARWWDYSHRRFNLHGRVCLAGAMLFGCSIVVVVHIVQPALNIFFGLWPVPLQRSMGALAALCLLSDLLITAAGLMGFRAMSMSVSDAIVDVLKERFANVTIPASVYRQLDRLVASKANAHKVFAALHDAAGRFSRINFAADVKSVIKHKLTTQQRRILQAFPHFEKLWAQQMAHDVWTRLREQLRRH